MTTPSSTISTPPLPVRLAVFIIGMFAFLQVYSVQAILPVLITDLLASEVQAGLAVGMTVMAIALVSPFIGMLSDSFGRKPFVVGAMICLVLPTALMAISSSIGEMSLWRFFQGLCIPAMTVVIIAYISEEYPTSTARLMTLYVAGTVLGGFLGRFVLGHLDEWLGWRMAFFVMAAMTMMGALIVLYALPSSQRFIKSGNFYQALTLLNTHRKNPQLIGACLLGACVLFSLVGCFTFINLHLNHAPYYLSSAELANIFAVYLIGVVITPLSARLMTALGLKYTMLIAIAASMMGLLITLSAPLWAIIVGLTIMSSGVFITQAATISHVSSTISEGRSLASGLYYMGYYAGGSIGAWLCGIAFRMGAWTAVVTLVFVVQILALMVVFALYAKK